MTEKWLALKKSPKLGDLKKYEKIKKPLNPKQLERLRKLVIAKISSIRRDSQDSRDLIEIENQLEYQLKMAYDPDSMKEREEF